MSVDPFGSTLSEMAVRSDPTKHQNKNIGTQNSSTDRTSPRRRRSDAPEHVDSRAEPVYNVVGTAEIRDMEVTGEMFSNRLAPAIERKGDWTEFRRQASCKNFGGTCGYTSQEGRICRF